MHKGEKGDKKKLKPQFNVGHMMPLPKRSRPKRLRLLPPPRGKHRYMNHQPLVEDIHRFLAHVLMDIGEEPDDIEEGTTWIELFCCFDILGFNSQQTEERMQHEATRTDLPQRTIDRRNRWIQHRLQHRARGRSGGLKKPLTTAEQQTDLTTEINTFTRIVKCIIKTSGNENAKCCYQAKEVGYKHKLGYIAATGYHPTVHGTLRAPHLVAVQIARALAMHRVGQTSKMNTNFQQCQVIKANEPDLKFSLSQADLTTRGPPGRRQGANWPPPQFINDEIEFKHVDSNSMNGSSDTVVVSKRFRMPLSKGLVNSRKLSHPTVQNSCRNNSDIRDDDTTSNPNVSL